MSGSNGEDRNTDLEELARKICELEEILRDVARPYRELSDYVSRFQEIIGRYFRLLDLYQKHGSISIDTILPEVKDPISKEITRILLDRPGLNISQITEELRRRTGSASRRIVRQRLSKLVSAGILVETTGKRAKTFELSEAVIKKWSQVLGFSK